MANWPAFIRTFLWEYSYAHSFTFVHDCFQTTVAELGSYDSVPWSRSLKYLQSDPWCRLEISG